MQADFSVELGADDPTLEFPWTDPDDAIRYYDLKTHPESITCLPEANANPALSEFLAAINSRTSLLQTAKCDAWYTRDLSPEEDIFGAAGKFVSYVDLVCVPEDVRYSFEEHENLAQRATRLLEAVPEIPAAVELIVRRCFFRLAQDIIQVQAGFYISLYVSGFGDDDPQARQHWVIALKLAENVCLQIAAEWAHGH
jgi:hypothetical protein